MEKKTYWCKKCNKAVKSDSEKCPNCGMDFKIQNSAFPTIMATILVLLGIIFIGRFVISLGSSDKETDAWICAQDLVKSELKYDSSSARFGSKSDATIIDLGEGKWSVKGNVEAKNGFGTYVEKTFRATFTMTESGYRDGYVSFY